MPSRSCSASSAFKIRDTPGGIGCKTYHHEGIGDSGHDVELVLECKREIIEYATQEIDAHENERDADDFFVFVYFVVLRANTER